MRGGEKLGRYKCAQGKKTGIGKANRICLIKRCPALLVQFKQGKFRQVIPVDMLDKGGC